MTKLMTGIKAELVEANEVIDRVLITRVVSEDEVETESLEMDPGARETFAAFTEPAGTRWKMLFEDPFTYRRCYSQRAPSYEIRPIEISDQQLG